MSRARERERGGGEEGKKSKYREKGNESPRSGKFTKEFIFTYLIEMVAGHFDEKKKRISINCSYYYVVRFIPLY